MNSLPLRIKITALAVLVAGLGMTVFGLTMTRKLEESKLENIDHILHKQAAGFFNALGEMKKPMDWAHDATVGELFSIVRSLYTVEIEQPPGVSVYRSKNLGKQSLPIAPDGKAVTVPIGDGFARVYQVEKNGIRFRIASDLAPTLATLRSMLLTFAATLPIIVVLIGLGAFWLARKALRPVQEIAKMAEAITASRLNERLPEPGTNDEIGEMTVTLNRMMDRLQASFEQSRRFASDASHELKTPLTIIRGEVEAALRSGDLPPSAERMMVNIQEETGRLVHIVEGLLLLSQADAGKLVLELTPLNISEFVDEMREDIEILANPRNITFNLTVQPGIIVDADARFLRQVLLNLFDNAIKYNTDSGRIDAVLEMRGSEAFFRISNSGRVISGEERERVFDRFFRSEPSRDRARGGQGLGLSICTEIIRSHHGGIALLADSMPGWTTFEFHIPLSKTAA